jgi:hypothetical protein
LRNRRSTFAGLTSPARFRLQGLATLLAVFSPRFRAGFVSHRRRSWDSPFGAFSSRKLPARYRTDGPTYRFLLQVNPPPKQKVGPTGHGSWVFNPSGNPWRPFVCLVRRPLDAPLGFALRGFARESLGGISPTLLSSAFVGRRLPAAPPAFQSLDRPSPGLPRPPVCKHTKASKATL